jgi:hypothetical protein
MRWQRRIRFWPCLTQRLTAGLLLIVYLTTSAGFLPLPSFASKKKDSRPFPCQDHPCGCATAEDCWRHCCCFTPEERWTWAREHNVQPPEYAERPAAKSWSTARLRDQAESQESQGSPHSNCAHCQAVACTDHAGAATPRENRPASSPTHSRSTLLLSAWHCQGLATVWMSTGAVLPLSPREDWNMDPPCIDRLSEWDACPKLLPVVTPDPPPRIS